MPQSPAETDLFQNSTMTFGQHLEELRTCLFRAIIGLAVGCVLGFLVGDRVVVFITTPVESALKTYYEKEATEKALSPEQQAMLRDAGYTTDAELERFRSTMEKQRLSFEIKSYDPKQFKKQSTVSAEAGNRSNPPSLPPDKVELPQVKKEAESPQAKKEIEPLPLKKIVLFDADCRQPSYSHEALGSQEAFMIWMKASMLVGIVLASPWVFYQIWTFVAAGLYPTSGVTSTSSCRSAWRCSWQGRQRRSSSRSNRVLAFLLSFNRMLHINPELRINEWMSFVLLLPLGFGISFQLPLVMLFLERIGLVTVKTYLASWRMAVLVIFVLAMLLTPSGDPYTMLLMACPLTLLYFGGVLLCKLLPKAKSRFAE